MKTKYTAIALIVASALIASTSFAESTGREVQVEHTQAVRSGNIMVAGENNAKPNELYPTLYAAKLAQIGTTRDLVAAGETSLKPNELGPNLYPAKQVQAGLTRVQVKAELAEALRTGDFIVTDEGPTAKCNELHPYMHRSI